MSEPIATQTRRHNAVVTGYVATTALADDADTTWQRLLDGRSGIGPLEKTFVSDYDLPVRIGGVLQMALADHLTRVERRRLSFVEQLAVVLVRGCGLGRVCTTWTRIDSRWQWEPDWAAATR